ncbi:MAG: hypothetical protein AB7V19_01160 [Candidatus Bipolaricaulia bacterium]
MTDTRDEYLRSYAGNLQWGGYAYLDVYCSVLLLRDRTYTDNELLGMARQVATYAKRREITNVIVDFFPPKTAVSRSLSSSSIARIVWAPNGDFMKREELGEYSTHRFRVVYNYARTQRASEANPYGL